MKAMAAALCLGASMLAGCGAKEVRPETELAAVTAMFKRDMANFARQRQAIVKARQRDLNEQRTLEAATQVDTTRMVTVWRMTKDTTRLELFEAVRAASLSAGESEAAIAKLREENEAALSAATTRFALDERKLGEVIQALMALGAERKLADQAKFYIAYVSKTREGLEALEDEIKRAVEEASQDKGAPSPSSPSAPLPSRPGTVSPVTPLQVTPKPPVIPSSPSTNPGTSPSTNPGTSPSTNPLTPGGR